MKVIKQRAVYRSGEHCPGAGQCFGAGFCFLKHVFVNLEKYFPTATYHQVSEELANLMEDNMARLRDGDKEQYTDQIYRVIRGHRFGLKETEIARSVGMERRRLNNYLRELQNDGRIIKEGRLWHSK
ncbi:MAG: hypothetical protein KDD84_19425 [Caldilineaceae bacterium]|nr:hypothetical protein [Caldilineaceae bacterium]